MKPLLTLALSLALFGVCGHCGSERWSTKTLSDPGAASLSYKPHDTTMAALFAIGLPPVDPIERVTPYETTLYRLRACLITVKHERDRDYHLVLSDGTRTMVAEIPDASNCSGVCRLDANHAKMVAARSVVDGLRLPAAIEVTGFGFLDRFHRQLGAIPVTFADGTRHNLEIHPALRVTPKGSCS